MVCSMSITHLWIVSYHVQYCNRNICLGIIRLVSPHANILNHVTFNSWSALFYFASRDIHFLFHSHNSCCPWGKAGLGSNPELQSDVATTSPLSHHFPSEPPLPLRATTSLSPSTLSCLLHFVHTFLIKVQLLTEEETSWKFSAICLKLKI
jgi:hypothetical protein